MNQDIKTIQYRDKKYPYLLRQIYNSPKKLYFRGDQNFFQKTCISIVGTRSFTEYGKMITQRIIQDLKVLDIAIVSGLALGVDTIAHTEALKNNIPTIAVLGSGLNNIYPRQNYKLAKEIEKNGLIITEYSENEEPIDFHFPARNRIVSGMSIATIVIEAPQKSGALITARLALEQGREIFVVPGDIDRENSLGTLKLLQKGGAYPICSGKEVIEILKNQPHLFKFQEPHKSENTQSPQKIEIPFNLKNEEQKIFSLIPKRGHTTLEKIHEKSQFPTQKILSIISLLEIKEIITSKNGKYVRKY